MKRIDFEKFECIGEEYNSRDCLPQIVDFINSDTCLKGKIMALYGLRRTGKSTLLQQALVKSGYKKGEFAFFELQSSDTMKDIEDCLEELLEKGIKAVAFDEITRAPDFISSSSSLPDIYAKYGMKILIAGTDSLGLMFASEHELFDRMKSISTTYISYAEHCRVFGTSSIDEYIEYGGLTSHGLDDIETGPVAPDSNENKYSLRLKKYLDSAVSSNIINSIAHNNRMRLRNNELAALSEKELVAIIEKATELYSGVINENEIMNALTKASVSYPFKKPEDPASESIFRQIRRNKATMVSEFAEKINAAGIIETKITEGMIKELDDYLVQMNFLSSIEIVPIKKKLVRSAGESDEEQKKDWEKCKPVYNNYIIQPAIKYNHLRKAFDVINNNPLFDKLSSEERFRAKEKLDGHIKGLMSEQIITFDTTNILRGKYTVIKPEFYETQEKTGEYDMLIWDERNSRHWSFEIKHSSASYTGYDSDGNYEGQDIHLVNENFIKASEERFGKFQRACVLYNGEPFISEKGTLFLNAGEFLISLDQTRDIEKTLSHFENEIREKRRPQQKIENKKLEEIFLKEAEKNELASFKKRDCYNKIANFIKKSNGTSGRIICLHGLRRTGKTTLMRQLQLEFGGKAYEVKSGQSMKNVFATLKEEHEKGTKLVFIDEITLAEGFVDSSALLADLYASAGMDIVVAGTDSLGLRLARRDQLYDRTFDIRTTLISFAEHNRVFGTISFDNEYKLYGGLMRKGLSDEEAVKDKESLNTFLDSAVAGNIAHTLSKAVDIDGYVELRRLKEQYLDKNLINKFVPDLAKIVKKTVEKYSGRINEFIVNNKMTKLSINAPLEDFLKREDESEEFKDRLRQINREKMKDEYRDRTGITKPDIPVTKELMEEVKEALLDIDLIAPVPTRAFRLTGTSWEQAVGKSTEYYIVPPAVKFWLLEEAKDVYFENSQISDKDAEKLSAQLDSDISGRVTETTVLYQTYVSLDNPRYFVFKPRFNIDNKLDLEYDMLIWDKQNGCHWAFEIKHSDKIIDVTEQAKEGKTGGQDSILLREDITEKMTEEYGPKRKNIVLYNGNGAVTPNKTLYINIADFLINIDRTRDIEKTLSHFENEIREKRRPQQKNEKESEGKSAEEFGKIFSGLLPDEKSVLDDFLKGFKDYLSDSAEPGAITESYNAAHSTREEILGASWGDAERRSKALDSVLKKLGITDPKFMQPEPEDRRDAMLIMRDISRNLDGFIRRKKEEGNRNRASPGIDVEAVLKAPVVKKNPPTPPGSPSGGRGGRADD